MTIGGGNLYVGNENSYEFEVPDIDGIEPVTILESLALPGAVYVSNHNYRDPARLSVRAPLTSAIGYVGYSPDGEGYASVRGSAGSWTTTGELYVGHTGIGTFRVEGGGEVNSAGAFIGFGFYAPGQATVTGVGSRWTNVGAFVIGESSGKLYVDDHASLVSTGPLHVGGGGSYYSDRSAIHVRGGAQMMTGDAFLAGGRTDAYVQGADSLWIVNGAVSLGTRARATLFIERGGSLVSQGAVLGGQFAGEGRVTVSGEGSLWADFSAINIGFGGAGSLLVADRAWVTTLTLAIGARGSTRLKGDGTISAAVFLYGGRLRFEGTRNQFGTLNVGANSVMEFVGDAANAVSFDFSGMLNWDGVLTIRGYVPGVDSLRVGRADYGLSAGQLSQIYFAEYGAYAQIDAQGYVTPAGM